MSHSSESSGSDQSPIEAQLAGPPPQDYRDPQARVGGANDERGDLLQSRAAVLAILFFVTGFLGLPLLWINRKFSNTERIVWSVVVTIYTCLLIAAVAWIVWWAWNQITP